MIAPSAPYNEVADWYEHDFLVTQRALGVDGFADRLGIDRSLAELLGAGTGTCLEIGCGTGIYADRIRQLGRTPIGVDVSTGMLHHAKPRLPTALRHATTLAVATASVPAVIAVMVHTDMADYPTVLAEAFRVLTPEGIFVHVGVHPCFCGGFRYLHQRPELTPRSEEPLFHKVALSFPECANALPRRSNDTRSKGANLRPLGREH